VALPCGAEFGADAPFVAVVFLMVATFCTARVVDSPLQPGMIGM